MAGHQLQESKEERDIGVQVTSDLKPGAQCAKAAKTASMVLNQIVRAFHYRDRNIFVKLYRQYVMPHLEFAGPAWAPWTRADIEVLEKVQRKAVGMVSGLNARSYEERLKELGMCTLEERRHQQDMIQTFKIIRGFDYVDSSYWFVMAKDREQVTRLTAGPLNINPQRSRLEIRRHYFSRRVTDSWNKIPARLKQARTIDAFKTGYLRYRLDMACP